jgi:hypothetical protein
MIFRLLNSLESLLQKMMVASSRRMWRPPPSSRSGLRSRTQPTLEPVRASIHTLLYELYYRPCMCYPSLFCAITGWEKFSSNCMFRNNAASYYCNKTAMQYTRVCVLYLVVNASLQLQSTYDRKYTSKRCGLMLSCVIRICLLGFVFANIAPWLLPVCTHGFLGKTCF